MTNEDEETTDLGLLGQLMDCFLDHLNAGEADLFKVQQDVVRFAVASTHMLLYDFAELAREENLDVDRAASNWLADVTSCSRSCWRTASSFGKQPRQSGCRR